MKKFVPTSFVALLLLLCSCDFQHDSGDQQASLISSEIVGGEATGQRAEYAPVVALSFRGQTLCTGTMMTPEFVLTAAHCVLPVELPGEFPGFLDELRVHTGPGIEGGEFSPESGHEIIAYFTHPHYQSGGGFRGAFDLGVLQLADPLENIETVRLFDSFEDERRSLSLGLEAELVGYGFRENVMGGFMTPSSSQVGVRHRVSLPVVDRNSTEVILSASGQSACLGDSGGPLFVRDHDGELVQVGVASRIMGACGGERTQTFYSRINHARCWLNAVTAGSSDQVLDPLCRDELSDASRTQHVIDQILAERGVQAEDVRELDLSGRLISDLSALRSLPKLERVNLSDNLIEDASVLAQLDSLEFANLKENYLREDFFVDFNQVELVGRYQQASTIHKTLFYRTCTGEHQASRDEQLIAEELLAMTGESDCLAAHKKVQRESMFTLEGLAIESFEMLADYPHFSMLGLSGNQIDDLSFMSEMRHLEALYLDDNRISDLSVLAGMPSLSYASVTNNEVEDIASLGSARDEHLMIRLDGNPVDTAQCFEISRLMCL